MMALLAGASLATIFLGLVGLRRMWTGRQPSDMPGLLVLIVSSGMLTLGLLISARMAG